MIISTNKRPKLEEFRALMAQTDQYLNDDAIRRPAYYKGREGNPLEDDVVSALTASAEGTSFAGTIRKISGQKFPDIVAADYYGVEVKSTKQNHWTSTGSSILESTRVQSVERIYMTFGKLGGNPAEFLSRPYEECLYDIAVTHMPRYLINMRVEKGNSIFDKMGIPYDELRDLDNPVAPVAKYYRERLKPGESLWWTGDSGDETSSVTIRAWSNFSREEQIYMTVYGILNYPEIFAGEYDRYGGWLILQGIVNTHIRDLFSAGGRELMVLSNGEKVSFPAVYRRVKKYKYQIVSLIRKEDVVINAGNAFSQRIAARNRLKTWCETVSRYADSKYKNENNVNYDTSMDVLSVLFEKNLA